METLTVTEQINQKHQEDLQRLKDFKLFDDVFLTKCFEGNTACIELVLQIILEKPDLKVLDVRTQVFVENLLNRSVRFDILATDSTGARINVEIQRSDQGAGKRRARYNCSMLDASLLEKGKILMNCRKHTSSLLQNMMYLVKISLCIILGDIFLIQMKFLTTARISCM